MIWYTTSAYLKTHPVAEWIKEKIGSKEKTNLGASAIIYQMLKAWTTTLKKYWVRT